MKNLIVFLFLLIACDAMSKPLLEEHNDRIVQIQERTINGSLGLLLRRMRPNIPYRFEPIIRDEEGNSIDPRSDYERLRMDNRPSFDSLRAELLILIQDLIDQENIYYIRLARHKNQRDRWNALKDVRYSMRLAGDKTPNTAMVIRRILVENDEAHLVLLEQKDVEVRALLQAEKDKDEEIHANRILLKNANCIPKTGWLKYLCVEMKHRFRNMEERE